MYCKCKKKFPITNQAFGKTFKVCSKRAGGCGKEILDDSEVSVEEKVKVSVGGVLADNFSGANWYVNTDKSSKIDPEISSGDIFIEDKVYSCGTCQDTGKCLDMVCYGGAPYLEEIDCPDCILGS